MLRRTAAVLACILLSAAAPAQNQAPAPRITADPPVIDLGQIPDDKPVTAHVTIRNEGDADLVISGITSTCGCTIPTIDGRSMDTKEKQAEKTVVTLPPGGSAAVDIEFHPSGKRNQQNQKVTVKSNDPSRGDLVIDVLAFVRPIVRVDPDVLNFGDVFRGEVKTITAVITGQTRTFSIPLVTSGAETITARVLDSVEDEEDGQPVRRVRVEFTLSASRPPGAVVGVAGIRTSDPRRRFLSVPYAGRVLGDLALDPDMLRLGVVEAGGSAEARIRLRHRHDKAFTVLDVKDRAPGVPAPQWRVLPAEPDADHPGAAPGQDLHLTLTAPTRPGAWKGVLVIQTDVPDQEKIEVSYEGAVRSTRPAPASAPR